jgi:hypothetical protein
MITLGGIRNAFFVALALAIVAGAAAPLPAETPAEDGARAEQANDGP